MKEQSEGNVLRANREGHVLIPSHVVAQLGVNSGEGLHWTIEDGRLVLMPRLNLVKKLFGIFGQPKQPTIQLTEKAHEDKTAKMDQSAKLPESNSKSSVAEGAS
jgi:antitoxin component of MazEF toxin-antitoxin module